MKVRKKHSGGFMASGVYQGNEQNKVLYKAFAPSGRRAKCDDTQGDALGYELLPLQGARGINSSLPSSLSIPCPYHPAPQQEPLHSAYPP